MDSANVLRKKAEVITKAWTNPEYKRQLMTDPRKVIAAEFAVDLPAGLTIKVLEDTADTLNLVLVDPASLPDEEKAGPKAAILTKAWTDPDFRQALLADPAAAIAQAFNATLPPGFNIKAVDQTDNAVYLVIPARSGELTDAALDQVAGGTTYVINRDFWDRFMSMNKLPVAGTMAGVAYATTGIIAEGGAQAYHGIAKGAEIAGHAIASGASTAAHAVASGIKSIFHGW